MKQLAKSLFARTPYRLVRDLGVNRFDGLEASLQLMRARGFDPSVIVDGGAHMGSFSLAVKGIFPSAAYHLIEPQPSCADPLRALCSKEGWTFHQCALSSDRGSSGLLTQQSEQFDTGAYLSDHPSAVQVRTETIDALFSGALNGQRAVLKLDLQGHELQALKGAVKSLQHIDVVVSEVSFFSHGKPPLVADIVAFMAQCDFALYDVLSLHGRTRDNRLKQGDLVFARSSSVLRQDDRWE